jgi:hypothetical protein
MPVENVFVNSVDSIRLARAVAIRIVLCVALGCAAPMSLAASVALHQDAVTAAVTRRLFTDNGRKLLAGNPSSCSHAYAERPTVTFRSGRVYLRMHFAGRAGLVLNGACTGATEAFDAMVSGEPYANGESIAVRDVRIDEGKKEYRGLLEPLLRQQLPALLGSNLRQELGRYLDSNIAEFKMAVSEFHLQNVTATEGVLTVRFDFALQGMRRKAP